MPQTAAANSAPSSRKRRPETQAVPRWVDASHASLRPTLETAAVCPSPGQRGRRSGDANHAARRPRLGRPRCARHPARDTRATPRSDPWGATRATGDVRLLDEVSGCWTRPTAAEGDVQPVNEIGAAAVDEMCGRLLWTREVRLLRTKEK